MCFELWAKTLLLNERLLSLREPSQEPTSENVLCIFLIAGCHMEIFLLR